MFVDEGEKISLRDNIDDRFFPTALSLAIQHAKAKWGDCYVEVSGPQTQLDIFIPTAALDNVTLFNVSQLDQSQKAEEFFSQKWTPEELAQKPCWTLGKEKTR